MAKKNAAEPAMIAADPTDGSEKDYQANSAYDTLVRASEHKADPDMMARVKKVAGRKHKGVVGLHAELAVTPTSSDDGMKPIKSIDDLRAAGSKLAAKKRASNGSGSVGNMG